MRHHLMAAQAGPADQPTSGLDVSCKARVAAGRNEPRGDEDLLLQVQLFDAGQQSLIADAEALGRARLVEVALFER